MIQANNKCSLHILETRTLKHFISRDKTLFSDNQISNQVSHVFFFLFFFTHVPVSLYFRMLFPTSRLSDLKGELYFGERSIF